MTTTRVPVLLSALVARLSSALAGVQVLDGPREAQELEPDVLVVGATVDGGPSVAVETVRQEGLGARRLERFTVTCLASSWSGGAGMEPRRERAGQLLAAVEDALAVDRGLGGVVERVTLGPTVEWTQAVGPDGVVVEVAFQVFAEALL